MQVTLFLGLLCTIAVLSIGLSDSAPSTNSTTKKPSTVKIQKTTSKPILVGGHTKWDTKIKPQFLKIFNDYKKITLKKLQAAHNVSATFNPKPDKVSTQVVGGINYHYLVKLPINKYAFVSIHHQAWKKDHYGKEDNVRVRPQTYELNDKIV